MIKKIPAFTVSCLWFCVSKYFFISNTLFALLGSDLCKSAERGETRQKRGKYLNLFGLNGENNIPPGFQGKWSKHIFRKQAVAPVWLPVCLREDLVSSCQHLPSLSLWSCCLWIPVLILLCLPAQNKVQHNFTCVTSPAPSQPPWFAISISGAPHRSNAD